MDKQIVTTLLIMAAVVTFAMAFQAIYPAVMRSSDAMVSAGRSASDRLKTDVQVIHAGGELDADGLWQDVNGDGDFDLYIWIKNVGSLSIAAPEAGDLFLGPEGNVRRVPHATQAGGDLPHWTYTVEGAERWDPSATLMITVHYGQTLSRGRYSVKYVTTNGLSSEYSLGM